MNKHIKRLLTVALLLCLTLTVLCVGAAADLAMTVGEVCGEQYFIALMEGDTVIGCSMVSGSLPSGISYDYSASGVYVYGTPTTAGKYSAGFSYITTNNPEGRSASVSITVTAAPPSPSTPPSTSPSPSTPPSTPPSTSPSPSTPPSASPSPSTSPTPSSTPTPAPVISKHPGGETIGLGGGAYFTARASDVTTYQWFFISADGGTTVNASSAAAYFDGLGVSGNSTEKLVITSVPKVLNGWKVYCVFTGPGGTATSNSAAIVVLNTTPTPKPTATPKPTPTATATPKPSATVSPTPTATPEPTATPAPAPTAEVGAPAVDTPVEDVHVHSYSTQWSTNATSHWHACDCGERGDSAEHSYVWEEKQAATKKETGIRTGVCGFEYDEVIPVIDDPGGFPLLAFIGIAAAIVVIGVIAVIVITKRTK